MKALRISILGWLATVLMASAQITQPGWYHPTRSITPVISGTHNQLKADAQGLEPLYSQSTPIAETITPDIQALADGLQDDPVKIFNYVHDHIRFVLYFGSKKGAELTLLEKSGNDFDQCALLVALLRAAGYTNVQYQFGLMQMPLDAANGTHNDLRHWLHLTVVNTNWNDTLYYFSSLLGVRGYPTLIAYGDTNTIGLQRVWVKLTIGATHYLLDPAFKVSEPVAGINLASAMGFNSNALMTAVGGTDTGTYAQYLNEANLRNALTGYTTNLLNYLQSNAPNASVEQILGDWRIVSATNTVLSQSLLFPQDTFNLPVETWMDEPTNLMSSLAISFAQTNYQWWMPQLQGDRLTLTYDANGVAELWQDDALLVSNVTSASDTSVVFSINHPYGNWNFSSNILVDATNDSEIVTNTYQRASATYDIMYAFEPDWGWLKERQQRLEFYLQEGLPSTSRQVTSETLNIMGLAWLLEAARAEQMLDRHSDVLFEYVNNMGRMAQEAGHGYYVDMYMEQSGAFSSASMDPASQDVQNRINGIATYFDSAIEHGIIEQMESNSLAAVSTVKLLQLANTNNQAVYLASSNNWSAVQGGLISYTADALVTINHLIGQGYYVLLPQYGANAISSAPGSWSGYGAAAWNPSSGTMNMLIAGNYNGGASSGGSDTTDPYYTDLFGTFSMFFFLDFSPFTFGYTAGDPVDMADGTFQVEHTDLALGGPEPRGITLSRYYNNTRRYSNPAGMAGGWVNNYYMNALAIPAPEAALGGTTPAQAAPMLAATAAALGIFNDTQPDPKNWLTTALIAKWGIDQLTKNGVSINLGKDTVEFVKQPNGTFTPPANCTMTLIQTNGVYWLQKRHGNTFEFNTAGLLSSIVDPYNQSLSLTYNSSNWVSTVTDWKGRSLTFHYTGSPAQLTSVSDNTGRSVYYGYSTNYSPQGDLTSFTDAEGKTTTYTYDTNHDITAVINPLDQMVVSNNYDAVGRVTTQLTEGVTNKTWHIFWSGWQTVAQDPAGGQQTYSYDDQTRLTDFEDALGKLTQIAYDGQDHVVMTVSPLDETNRYVYDGHNNLIATIDPLDFTNQFVYDNQNNLIQKIDPRGNISTFGYNSEFSLTSQTNGAGDWVNYTYNSDGTRHSRADAAGTTTYGYDSYGQLNSITYPGGLGSEGFVNDALGDVISRTDGNGNVTTFQYNERRELTNTIAPTNVVTSVVYNPDDDVISTMDARGNMTSNTWSATRRLLTTTLPPIAAGTPVTTRIYDSRDWLVKTLNPLDEPTLYTNDLNGRRIAQTDPVLRTTTFGYDGDGQKIASINAANETNSQTWDARGKLIQLTDGAGHFSLRAYDAAGNQIILTNRNGKVWHFQYDGANRLTNTISPMQRMASRAFNDRGLLAATTDPAHQNTFYYYDAKGRLTNRTDNVGTVLYGYDANDNLTNIAETQNSKLTTQTFSFDAYNRMSSFKDAYGNLIQYRYDANGNLTNLIYPGGKNVYYTYDNDNHLTQVRDWSGRITTLTYDLAGRLTSITRPNGTERIVGYDAAGQVTNIVELTTAGPTSYLSGIIPIALYRFNWNAAAEIQWEFAAPLPHTNSVPTRTMTYNDDNELVTVNGQNITEDPDGNLTYGPLTNDNFVSYTFDARNRLLNVGGVTNIYDAANNRIGQTYGTNSVEYAVNPNAKLPQVLERIKNGATTYYIYGAGLLYQITETATATNTLTYHYDYRGSTIALTDDNGNVVDRFEYSLYATMTYRSGTDDTPFLFNGRYGVMTDPNGLLCMRARYYNPYICRFLNPDPSGFKGGLNFYAYANGNPVSTTDPSGLGAWGDNGGFSWTWGWNGTPINPANPFGFGSANESNFGAWLNNLNLSYSLSPNTANWQSIAFSGGIGNNFALPGNLSGGAGTGWSYNNTTTTLGGVGLLGSFGEYGLGAASFGINNASGEIGFYSHFYGNQYVSVAMVSDIGRAAGPYLFAANTVNEAYGVYSGQVSPATAAIDVTVGYIGWRGGPIGASFAGGYFLGSLIQANVNQTVENGFQLMTDWYYGSDNIYVEPIFPNFPNP